MFRHYVVVLKHKLFSLAHSSTVQVEPSQEPKELLAIIRCALAAEDPGNLYCAGPQAVRVWSPDGRLLETIAGPESPTNCTFAGAGSDMLYITGRKRVYRIRMNAKGVR